MGWYEIPPFCIILVVCKSCSSNNGLICCSSFCCSLCCYSSFCLMSSAITFMALNYFSTSNILQLMLSWFMIRLSTMGLLYIIYTCRLKSKICEHFSSSNPALKDDIDNRILFPQSISIFSSASFRIDEQTFDNIILCFGFITRHNLKLVHLLQR